MRNNMKEIAYLHNFCTTKKDGLCDWLDIFLVRENGNVETCFVEYGSIEDFTEEEINRWIDKARFLPIEENNGVAVTIGNAAFAINTVFLLGQRLVPVPDATRDSKALFKLKLQYFNAFIANELTKTVFKKCMPFNDQPL